MTFQNPALHALMSALTLQKIADNRFVGPSFDFVGPRVFGGQVLAQALLAAFYTLTSAKPCHSLHAYFLRGGDIRYPVQYTVSVLRDGNSLSARQVTASQMIDGKDCTIFTMLASFAVMDNNLLDGQKPMPSYPPPTAVPSEQEFFAPYIASNHTPNWLKERLSHPRPVTVRLIDPRPLFNPPKAVSHQALWLTIDELDSNKLPAIMPSLYPPIFHQACLAFASDLYLVSTALIGQGMNLLSKDLQVASIDHSLHFHRPFDIIDWLLYELKSDIATYDKGLNNGQFWQHGQLVATSQQEGLMRYRPSLW